MARSHQALRDQVFLYRTWGECAEAMAQIATRPKVAHLGCTTLTAPIWAPQDQVS